MAQDHLAPLAELGWQPHASKIGWFTRSPYLAAPLWDWADKTDAGTVAALGPWAWNYKTSFADAPIPDCGIDAIRLPLGERPYPFQIAGVQRALLRNKILIADQMGLGKSLQALAVANMVRPQRMIIGCPAFIALDWAAMCERWLVDAQAISVLDGARRSIPDRGVVIVPYSRGHNFARQILAGPAIDLCVMDEIHFCKDDYAKRTVPWLGKDGIARHARRVIGLTGTPMPNNSSEIYGPLSVLAAEMMRGISRDRFQERYCSVFKLKKKIETPRGTREMEFPRITSRNETILNAELRASGVMVRRLKNDVLKQLPPKNIYFVHMTPSAEIADLVREESTLYEQLTTKIMTAQELFALRGHTETIRTRLGLLKAPKIAEYVKYLFDSGEDRIVLFMLHTEAIDAIAKIFAGHLTVHILDGRVAPHKRKPMVDDFQTPGGRKLAIGQVTAAGIGLTMTAARYAVSGELAWTPGTNEQAWDRIHRITQTRQCEIPVLTFPHAVEERVIRTNAKKAISAINVLDINLSSMLSVAAE